MIDILEKLEKNHDELRNKMESMVDFDRLNEVVEENDVMRKEYKTFRPSDYEDVGIAKDLIELSIDGAIQDLKTLKDYTIYEKYIDVEELGAGLAATSDKIKDILLNLLNIVGMRGEIRDAKVYGDVKTTMYAYSQVTGAEVHFPEPDLESLEELKSLAALSELMDKLPDDPADIDNDVMENIMANVNDCNTFEEFVALCVKELGDYASDDSDVEDAEEVDTWEEID